MSPLIVVLPHEQGPRIVVLESTTTRIFDAKGAPLPDLPPARDAVTADVDADGSLEVLLCGASGVLISGWERARDPIVLDPTPCRKIGRVGDTLVVVNTSAHLYAVPGLADRGAWGPWLEGEPLLATSATGFALGSSGSTTVTTSAPDGNSTIATGRPPTDVAYTPTGPVWLLDDRVTDALFHDLPAGPTPTALITAQGARGQDLFALGGDGALRDVNSGAAVIFAGPLESVAAADLDGDGCDEFIAWFDSTIHVIPGPTCPRTATEPSIEAVQAHPEPPPEPPPTELAPVFGLHIPPSLGPDPTDPEPLHWSDRYVGVGAAIASGLPGVWPFVPVFPALTFETVWGGPRIRGLFGVDSSGFLVWIGDTGTLHLLNTTYGVALGGRDLQFGPIAALGLFDAGIGFRASFTPLQVHNGDGRMGLEARILAFAGGAGETDLLWVWRSAGRNQRRVLEQPGRPLCTSLAFLLGAAGGFSSTDGSWQYVGADQPWAPAVSPFAGVACEADGFVLGFETAPAYGWLLPPTHDRVHHMGSHTFGPMFERGDLRFGPIGQVGIWTAGLGGRVAWTGFEDAHGRKQGLDIRAIALFPYAPAWEFTAAWGIWTDPRR